MAMAAKALLRPPPNTEIDDYENSKLWLSWVECQASLVSTLHFQHQLYLVYGAVLHSTITRLPFFFCHTETAVSTHLLDQDSDLASGMAELESSWFPGVVCLCFLRLCFVAQTIRARGWKITQQLATGAGHYKHRASNWYWCVKAAIRQWLLQGKKLKYLSFCYCLIITSNCYVLGWVMKKCLLKIAVIKKYITPIWKSIR